MKRQVPDRFCLYCFHFGEIPGQIHYGCRNHWCIGCLRQSWDVTAWWPACEDFFLYMKLRYKYRRLAHTTTHPAVRTATHTDRGMNCLSKPAPLLIRKTGPEGEG